MRPSGRRFCCLAEANDFVHVSPLIKYCVSGVVALSSVAFGCDHQERKRLLFSKGGPVKQCGLYVFRFGWHFSLKKQLFFECDNESMTSSTQYWVTVASFVLVILTFTMMFIHCIKAMFYSEKVSPPPPKTTLTPEGQLVQCLSKFTAQANARSVRDISTHRTPLFVFFTSPSCLACSTLFVEWTALHRCMPVLLSPDKKVDLLRVDLSEDVDGLPSLGDKLGFGSVVPTLGLLKDGTWDTFVQCDRYTFEEWVGWLRLQLPSHFDVGLEMVSEPPVIADNETSNQPDSSAQNVEETVDTKPSGSGTETS